MSSHSVGAAIKQPFFLRRVDFISIGLLCLWSLSPLASQAMQRMSYNGPVYNSAATTVPYVDTTGLTDQFSNQFPFFPERYSILIQGLYTASLLSPPKSQNSPTDIYDNVKIPLLEGLDTVQNGWYPVQNLSASSYSSLLGLPCEFPAQDTEDSQYDPAYSSLDMIMQSAYLTVANCTPQVVWTLDQINQTVTESGSSLVQSTSGTLLMSMHFLGGVVGSPESDPNYGAYTKQALPAILTFSSAVNFTDVTDQNPSGVEAWSYTACHIGQTFVDSQISCSDHQCQVVGMRSSLNASKELSTFSAPNHNGTAFQPSPFFVDFLIDAGSTLPKFNGGATDLGQGVSTLAEQYIADPAYVIDVAQSNFVDITRVPLPEFQQRLALVLNTFWQAGMAPMEQTTGLNITPIYVDTKYALNATYTQGYDAYQVSWGWIAVLFISSTILLAAGIASIIFDVMTIGPDVLGFASSLTRNNKYMDLPKDKDNGTMSGAERTKVLGDVKVMIQDVKPGAPVGKIALGTISEGTRRLARDRLYK
jgi:hypothetical protein